MKTNLQKALIILAVFAGIVGFAYLLSGPGHENDVVYNVDMKIVSMNYDCSLTDDKFRKPQMCNVIL